MIKIWHLRSFWGYLRFLRSFDVIEAIWSLNWFLLTKIDFQHSVSNVPEQVKFAWIFLLMHEKTKSTHQRLLKSLSHQTESLISLGTSWALILFHYCVFKPFKGLLIFHRTPLLLCHDCPIHQWYWSWNCFSLLSYYSIVNGCPFVFLKAFCSARHLSIVFENHIKRSRVWLSFRVKSNPNAPILYI